MPIRLRFLLVANVFLVGLGIMGFLAVTRLDRAAEDFSETTARGLTQVQMSDQLRANIPDLRTLELDYVTNRDPIRGMSLRDEIATRRKTLRTAMTQYHQEGKAASLDSCSACHRASASDTVSGVASSQPALVVLRASSPSDSDTAGRQAVETGCIPCHRVYQQFLEMHRRIVALATDGRQDDALAAFRASEGQYSALLQEADSFRDSQYELVRSESIEGHAAGVAARNTLVGMFAAAAVITFLVGHHFSVYIHRRLAVLGEGTRRVIRGELERPIEMRGRDEFTQLAAAFNTMTSSLQRSHVENVELHDAAISLREERIALLSDGLRRATEAQENERMRVARELHDEVGQALTGLQFGLGRVARMTRSARIREMTESLKELTVDTLKGVRSLALDLRPSLLDSIGLAPTLHHYCESYSTRTGIPVGLTITGLAGRLQPALEITLFRIVQEALTNTARYSGASQASVGLSFGGGTLRLAVRDNGRGFDVEATRADYRRCLGLSGMEERCRFSGGTLVVESAPGDGTVVTCTWSEVEGVSDSAAAEAPVPAHAPADLSTEGVPT